jgi:Z1 domain
VSLASEAENWLRVANTHADAFGLDFDVALDQAGVPEEVRADVRALRDRQARQVIQRVRGVSAGGPKAWYADYEPAQGFYWQRQRGYLLDQVARSPEAVDATDDDSSRVLSYLEDPRSSGPNSFDIRGLVVGHVQSGKTENFSALIAKASDLGYRFIIVLSGIHNELRQQTQRRLERELGLSDIHPGVGLPPAGQKFNNPTWDDLHGDFRSDQHDPSILQGNERVIVVVKKWWTVLQDLNDFIEKAQMPSDMAVLVIDDEADQASINTGGNRPDEPAVEDDPIEDRVDADPEAFDLAQETDPSTTNGLIRALLSKFQRSAYVAYTATPFANVLIPHDAKDRQVWEDLFPRDFLLTLDPRPGYVGAGRLFGRDTLDGTPEGAEEGLDVIRFVEPEDLPDVSPKYAEVKVADFEPSVPASLQYAIQDWVLATAALTNRMGSDHPSTMLIHLHQRTSIQNAIKPLVEAAIAALRRDWRYDRSGSTAQKLRDRWGNFESVSRRIDPARECAFDYIEEYVDRLLKDPVPVLALNSASTDGLDFRQTPDLKAILIGGNRLSRGITVEGLTVSYFVRESPTMDTLLQMCRWFGYRESYVDLTRLWTTRMLASWFRDIALREVELRDQIHEAECDHLPPVKAGYRIRSHPAMMVTSQAKMGAGQPENISYAGKLIQTSRMRLFDVDWLRENLEAAKDLFTELGEPDAVADASSMPRWSRVSPDRVIEFLRRYRTVLDRSTFDADTAADYVVAQLRRDELQDWTIAIRTQGLVHRLGTVGLGGTEYPTISRTRLSDDHTSVGVLSQPADPDHLFRGDEEIGLPESALLEARNQLAAEEHASLRNALIAQRNPDQATLIVYPISPFSVPRSGSEKRVALFVVPAGKPVVIGVAIIFPLSESAATVEYISGSSPGGDEEQ